MKIRSITNFYDPSKEDVERTLSLLAKFNEKAKASFSEEGYEVQTTRLATIPFPHYLPLSDLEKTQRQVCVLERFSTQHGFSYLSLGPALPDFPESYRIIPELLRYTQSTFFSGIMATREKGIILPAVRACASIIESCSSINPDGFTNLNFTALANVLPFGPFFPAAYHDGDDVAFALALESADLAVKAFMGANSLDDARKRLIESIEENAVRLEKIATQISRDFKVGFKGMDFSLAPFPEDWCSLGGAIESLGAGPIGSLGSLGAAAFVADALDRGQWKKAGFNGLMLPVLEDSILAQRTIDGSLTVRDLLLYSAVCGTGLDTVPLPGNASAAQLEGLLLDVAALSIRLDKPLTARLMPVPGKKAGEMTAFDFAFFANGRILDIPARQLTGKLAGEEAFILQPRYKY